MTIIITTITSFGIGLCIGFGYLIYKTQIEHIDENNNRTNNDYEKMYKIIEIASELDKDPYKRKISPKVVIKFCKIAKSKSINLDTITDVEFDLIYKTYTDYLIQKYEKNKKIHNSD